MTAWSCHPEDVRWCLETLLVATTSITASRPRVTPQPPRLLWSNCQERCSGKQPWVSWGRWMQPPWLLQLPDDKRKSQVLSLRHRGNGPDTQGPPGSTGGRTRGSHSCFLTTMGSGHQNRVMPDSMVTSGRDQKGWQLMTGLEQGWPRRMGAQHAWSRLFFTVTERGHFLGDFHVLPGPKLQVNSSAHAPSQSPASGQPLFCWPQALSPFTQASHAPATRATSLPPPPFWGQQVPEQPSTRRTGLPAQEMSGAFCPLNSPPSLQAPSIYFVAIWCCSGLAMGWVPHTCPCGAFPPPALSSVSAQ